MVSFYLINHAYAMDLYKNLKLWGLESSRMVNKYMWQEACEPQTLQTEAPLLRTHPMYLFIYILYYKPVHLMFP